MSAVSSREKSMVLVTVVVVLYAAAGLSFKKQVANWKAEQRVYATAQKKFREEKALIAAREEWVSRYEQVRDLMPVFPYDKDVDTHWLNVMDSAATRNGLTISRRQANKEAEVGDVYELPIDCKDWEGSLEALVKFLYDLNNDGAMLDVRQLYIRPSNKPGYLKGTFTLYCAYMRGEVEKQAPAVTVPVEEPSAETPLSSSEALPPAAGEPAAGTPMESGAPEDAPAQAVLAPEAAAPAP
jgi:Tfp pilus assembly protein PilO